MPPLLRSHGSLGGSSDVVSPRRWEVWLPSAQSVDAADDEAAGVGGRGQPAEDRTARLAQRHRRLSVGRGDTLGFPAQPDGPDGGGAQLYGVSQPSRTNMLEIALGRITEVEAALDGLRSKLNKGLVLRVTRDKLRESMVQLTLQVRGGEVGGPADPWAPSRTAQDLSSVVARRTEEAAGGQAAVRSRRGSVSGTGAASAGAPGPLGVTALGVIAAGDGGSGGCGGGDDGGTALAWRSEVASAVASLQRAVGILEQRVDTIQGGLLQNVGLEAKVVALAASLQERQKQVVQQQQQQQQQSHLQQRQQLGGVSLAELLEVSRGNGSGAGGGSGGLAVQRRDGPPLRDSPVLLGLD